MDPAESKTQLSLELIENSDVKGLKRSYMKVKNKINLEKKNQNLGFKKENVSKSFKRFGNEFKLKEFQKGNIFKLF